MLEENATTITNRRKGTNKNISMTLSLAQNIQNLSYPADIDIQSRAYALIYMRMSLRRILKLHLPSMRLRRIEIYLYSWFIDGGRLPRVFNARIEPLTNTRGVRNTPATDYPQVLLIKRCYSFAEIMMKALSVRDTLFVWALHAFPARQGLRPPASFGRLGTGLGPPTYPDLQLPIFDSAVAHE